MQNVHMKQSHYKVLSLCWTSSLVLQGRLPVCNLASHPSPLASHPNLPSWLNNKALLARCTGMVLNCSGIYKTVWYLLLKSAKTIEVLCYIAMSEEEHSTQCKPR